MPIATLACLIAGLLLSTFARAEVAVFFAGGQSNATARWSKGIEAALKGSGRFDEVLVVHANQGATGMTAWLNDRTENLYDKHFFSSTPGTPGVLQKALGDLAAAGKSYSFQGLFWFQGETDAKNGEQSLWVSRFSSLISSLQNDLGTSHWKYVITAVDVDTSTALGLSRLDGINELRAAMTSFVASTPNALIIDSRGWPRTPVNELYHLTEDDRYALGGQTAGIFLSATAVPEPARSGLFAAALILLISLGIKRNKRGALCALTALCASLSLPDARAWGLRVDIAGHPDGIELSPATGAAANAALQNATWGDPAARKRSLFFQRRDLPDGQSAQLEFTFIPAQSGKVTLRLNGCWAKDPKQAQGVVYEKVEATGGVLMNPDFSDRTGTGSLRYWWFENAALPLARGVKGWHGSSIAQYLTVSEGTAVTIKLVAREAGAQEQAAPLPQAAPPVSFKQGDWKLTIDGATGTWKNLEYKNIPLYQNPSGQPSFILNGENTQGNRILKRHTFDPATGTASIITTNGTWLFEERLAFGKRIKREVLATFSGEGGGGGRNRPGLPV